MSEDNGTLRDELVDDKVSDEGIANLDEAKGHDPKTAEKDSVDSVDKASDAAPKAKMPKTKAGMIKAAYDKMHTMKKDDLAKTVEKMMYEAKDEDEDDMEDGDSEMSKKSKKKDSEEKEEGYKGKKKDSMKEDIDALVDSEATLSEGFKEKAEVIFEAALNARVGERIEELEEQYQSELSEETEKVRNELTEQVDQYLGYVVENWMEENKLAVENGLRAEIAESFMGALKGVFQEHYVEVPESKVDLVDELASKVDHLEEELNASVTKSMTLREKVEELTRNKIIHEASEDLTAAQSEKLRGLAEGIDFENESSFEEKISTIKESYFGNLSTTTTDSITEDLDEADVDDETPVSGSMAAYLQALKRSAN